MKRVGIAFPFYHSQNHEARHGLLTGQVVSEHGGEHEGGRKSNSTLLSSLRVRHDPETLAVTQARGTPVGIFLPRRSFQVP